MSLDGSGYEELVEYGGSVGKQAVDYHWRYVQHWCQPVCDLESTYAYYPVASFCRLNLLFWTHYIGDTVNQASLDGSDASVIASGVDTPSNALNMT